MRWWLLQILIAVDQLANALAAAYAEMEKDGPPAGILEAVEQDEGEVVAADPLPPAPKSKKKAEPAEVSGSHPEEAEAAHVDR